MNEQVGIVYGEIVGNSFSFVSESYIDTSYVCYRRDGDRKERAICEIIECTVKNKYLDSPGAIKFFDETVDYKKENIYIYKAKVLNVINDDGIVYDKFPALPGEKIYDVSNDDLMTSFGVKSGDISFGSIIGIPRSVFRVTKEQLFSPHLLVVGKTGSGKSYLVKHILEAFDSVFWIISPSNEYNYLENYGAFVINRVVLRYNIDDVVNFAELNLSEEMILRKIDIDNTGIIDYRLIKRKILDYYSGENVNDDGQLFFDTAGRVKLSGKRIDNTDIPRYAESLINKIKKIGKICFSKDEELVTHIIDKKCVFDLSEYSQKEQECIINSILFRLRIVMEKRTNNNKKAYVLIEEAHNYVPSTTNTFCKHSIVRLSREGRKMGISLGLITQRPRFFDQTVISQVGTKIVFALSNPEDITRMTDEMAHYDSDIVYKIQSQRTGECMIVSGMFNTIIECRVGTKKVNM